MHVYPCECMRVGLNVPVSMCVYGCVSVCMYGWLYVCRPMYVCARVCLNVGLMCVYMQLAVGLGIPRYREF